MTCASRAARHGLLCLVSLACLAPALSVSVAPARAQSAAVPSRVQVTVSGLFGDDVIVPSRFNPYVVTVENRSRQALRGEVTVRLKLWNAPPAVIHRIPLDVDGRSTRRAVIDVFVYEVGLPVEARYEVDGAVLGSAEQSVSYRPPRGAIVTIDDDPILTSTVRLVHVPKDGSDMPIPVGEARIDVDSGDLMLPARPSGWAPVDLVVARVAALERASKEQLDALLAHVVSGGVVLLFPRTAHDLSSPVVTRLAGPITVEPESERPSLTVANGSAVPSSDGSSLYVPLSVEPLSLRGGPGTTREPFGIVRTVGLGRVYVAGYDAGSANLAAEPAVVRLIGDIYAAREKRERTGRSSWLPPFREPTRAGADAVFDGFSMLQHALDPNANYRPALVAAALLLLLYVVVVGPLNFRAALRRNRPALVLLTTPIIALVCIAAMFVVGYVGKGIELRYRALELIEAAEGRREASSRKYAGLFVTRPLTFEIPPLTGGYRYPLIGLSASPPPGMEITGIDQRLSGLRARLWETLFVREDFASDLGGKITWRDDRSKETPKLGFGTVINGTPHVLRGAVLYGGGKFYRVGTLAAGESQPVSTSPISLFPTHAYGSYGGIDQNDASVSRFMKLMELDEDSRELVFAFLRLTILARVPTEEEPSLLAWIEPSRERYANLFEPDRGLRFVRIVPRQDDEHLTSMVPSPMVPTWPSPPPPHGGSPAVAGAAAAPVEEAP